MTNQFTSHHKLLHSSLLGSHILLTNIHKFKINFAGGKQNIHFPYCCSHPFLICNCGIEYEISDINYVTNSTDANKVKHSHPMVRFPWCPIAVQYNMQQERFPHIRFPKQFSTSTFTDYKNATQQLKVLQYANMAKDVT